MLMSCFRSRAHQVDQCPACRHPSTYNTRKHTHDRSLWVRKNSMVLYCTMTIVTAICIGGSLCSPGCPAGGGCRCPDQVHTPLHTFLHVPLQPQEHTHVYTHVHTPLNDPCAHSPLFAGASAHIPTLWRATCDH
jgi:hypothetical protein